MVTTMISLPSSSALARSPDFDLTSGGLAAAARSIPRRRCRVVVDLGDRVLQLRVEDVAVGDHNHRFEHLSLFTCSRAIRWAVQAIESVLPEPAEC